MTGCLQIKNGMYYIVLSISEGGKRKRPWFATGLPAKGNKRKAEKLLREKLLEFERKSGVIRSDVLFSDYVRQWLTVAQRKVDEVTYQGYESLARVHVLPYFDALGVKLQDITLTMLQTYIDEKRDHGRKDGKGGLSARSLRLHKNILHQTLDEAVKGGLLPSNPCLVKGLMLDVLDGYPVNLPCRYADKVACFTKVYLVSNVSLEQQYPNIQLSEPVTFQAFRRRINQVVDFSPDDGDMPF